MSEKIKGKIETWLGKFDLLDVLCQTFLAHVKAVQLPDLYYGRREMLPEMVWASYKTIVTYPSPSLKYDLCTLYDKVVSLPVGHDSRRLCAFIDGLLEYVPWVDGSFGIDQLVSVYWDPLPQRLNPITGSTTVRIVVLAAFHGIHEYVLRDEPRTRSIMKESFKPHLLAPLIAATATSEDHQIALGLLRIFEIEEISPNLPSLNIEASSWHEAILTVLENGLFNYLHLVLPLFATCLLRGGDTRFYLHIRPQPKDSGWAVVDLSCGKERTRIEDIDFDRVIKVTPALKHLLLQHGPDISLRDLMGIWFLRHATLLQDIFDWIEEREPELDHEQLQELHDTFELATRPLRYDCTIRNR
jgi:hypothetical protein